MPPIFYFGSCVPSALGILGLLFNITPLIALNALVSLILLAYSSYLLFIFSGLVYGTYSISAMGITGYHYLYGIYVNGGILTPELAFKYWCMYGMIIGNITVSSIVVFFSILSRFLNFRSLKVQGNDDSLHEEVSLISVPKRKSILKTLRPFKSKRRKVKDQDIYIPDIFSPRPFYDNGQILTSLSRVDSDGEFSSSLEPPGVSNIRRRTLPPSTFIIEMDKLHREAQQNTLNTDVAQFENILLSGAASSPSFEPFNVGGGRRVMTPEVLHKELADLREKSS